MSRSKLLFSNCFKIQNKIFSKRLYHSDPPLKTMDKKLKLMAPMVDYSSLPFRLLVRNYGIDITYTQMFNAKIFMSSSNYRERYMDWRNHTDIDRPLVVQLAGDDPKNLIGTAKYFENEVDGIDLNLGCPQQIAKSGHYGAYLLEEEDLVIKILSEMVSNIACPISAKIRLFSCPKRTLEFCQRIEACGVKRLIVHGRTVKQSKTSTGPANWDLIKQIKEKLSIPVIANGGISCLEDMHDCLSQTGADGVMVSEALLENPKFLTIEGNRRFFSDFIRLQLETAEELINLFYQYASESQENMLRNHLFKIMHRIINAPGNNELRQEYISTPYREVLPFLDKIRAKYSTINFDHVEAFKRGWLHPNTWYMRHVKECDQATITQKFLKDQVEKKVDS